MPLTSAEKMRAMRARAKALGLCTGCCKRKPRRGLTKCRACNEACKVSVARSRGKDV